MQKFRERIKKDDYLLLHEEEINFITVFCTKEYDYNDYDILSKVQRDYLKKSLIDFNYIWFSGSILKSETQYPNIVFPKYKIRSFFPKQEVFAKDPSAIYAITPTQYAYYLMRENKAPKEKIIDLIYSQPINIDKLTRYFPLEKELLAQLKQEQDYALRTTALRYKNQIDSTF